MEVVPSIRVLSSRETAEDAFEYIKEARATVLYPSHPLPQ
jgi:hypothetical protein